MPPKPYTKLLYFEKITIFYARIRPKIHKNYKVFYDEKNHFNHYFFRI